MSFRNATVFKLDEANIAKFAGISLLEARVIELALYKSGVAISEVWDFEFMPHSNRVCATRAYFPLAKEEKNGS